MSATAQLAAPKTVYAFPGRASHHKGWYGGPGPGPKAGVPPRSGTRPPVSPSKPLVVHQCFTWAVTTRPALVRTWRALTPPMACGVPDTVQPRRHGDSAAAHVADHAGAGCFRRGREHARVRPTPPSVNTPALACVATSTLLSRGLLEAVFPGTTRRPRVHDTCPCLPTAGRTTTGWRPSVHPQMISMMTTLRHRRGISERQVNSCRS